MWVCSCCARTRGTVCCHCSGSAASSRCLTEHRLVFGRLRRCFDSQLLLAFSGCGGSSRSSAWPLAAARVARAGVRAAAERLQEQERRSIDVVVVSSSLQWRNSRQTAAGGCSGKRMLGWWLVLVLWALVSGHRRGLLVGLALDAGGPGIASTMGMRMHDCRGGQMLGLPPFAKRLCPHLFTKLRCKRLETASTKSLRGLGGSRKSCRRGSLSTAGVAKHRRQRFHSSCGCTRQWVAYSGRWLAYP